MTYFHVKLTETSSGVLRRGDSEVSDVLGDVSSDRQDAVQVDQQSEKVQLPRRDRLGDGRPH